MSPDADIITRHEDVNNVLIGLKFSSNATFLVFADAINDFV
jgi:hypothetical protein